MLSSCHKNSTYRWRNREKKYSWRSAPPFADRNNNLVGKRSSTTYFHRRMATHHDPQNNWKHHYLFVVTSFSKSTRWWQGWRRHLVVILFFPQTDPFSSSYSVVVCFFSHTPVKQVLCKARCAKSLKNGK